MKNRVNYVDNLRWLTVSLLIFYHAAMAYNTWDEANYIHLGENKAFAAIVTFISPWFMPLMFLLAGVSASYSL
nr:acyltransferase family protein [Eubacterium sp.]